MTFRNEAKARVSTVHTSDGKSLVCTKKDHRGCVSQTILDRGKDWRNAATAGKVWMMSPSDPSRTTRKRGSGMRRLPHRIDKFACGMIFGVADNRNANTKPLRGRALRNVCDGVIGPLGVNVGSQFGEQRFNVALAEDQDIFDRSQRSHQSSACSLWKNRTPISLQGAYARIGIHSHNQNIALAARAFEIARVAHVQRVKATVGQH